MMSISVPGSRLRLPLFLALVVGTLLAGGWMMFGILAAGGLTIPGALILLLFIPTFGWISLAFWTGALGFLFQLLRVDPLTLQRVPPRPSTPTDTPVTHPGSSDAAPPVETILPPDSGRTAVVMPAHNEDPERALRGLEAVAASLRATGSAHAFDLHFLSDTTDPAIRQKEEEVWAALIARWGHDKAPRIHYRRRSTNTGRKPGNIGAFCRKHHDDYEYLVVLDADSHMEGGTLVSLVRTMEANPRAGLVQTVPLPWRQETLFGRLLQFGSALYGPMLARGYAFWQGASANYWGHNAILRLAPFVEHGHLPVLPGTPPLGGEILSHDFVEGALLRRAGWDCYLLTELEGSHEELPGNLVDFTRRDRRWAQGSLQHLRLLATPGLRPTSRLHFLTGAMGYLSSVFWFLMLLAGTAYVARIEWNERTVPSGTDGWQVVERTEAGGWQVVGEGAGWTVPDALLPPGGGAVSLLWITAVILFLPRLLALVLGLIQRSRGFGGRARLTLSALLETAFTVIMAPILMWSHTRFVAGILAGRTVRWDSQPREGRELTRSEAWHWSRTATLLGVVWTTVALAASPLFVLWLSPILVGLVLALPVVHLTSRVRPGDEARALGLFLVPWEVDPAPIAPGEPQPNAAPAVLLPAGAETTLSAAARARSGPAPGMPPGRRTPSTSSTSRRSYKGRA